MYGGEITKFFIVHSVDFFCPLCISQIIFVLNWLAGFTLVCIILPIDLLCMSFMRYIRFQFEVIKDDLVNGLNVRRHTSQAIQFIIVFFRLFIFSSICVRMPKAI